jgi:hypothetical protein
LEKSPCIELQGVSGARPKPADRLRELREQIRTLKAEESTIRQGLIDGSLDAEGDDHRAVVTVVENERIDLATMRQHVDDSIWPPFAISTPTIYVKTERKLTKKAMHQPGKLRGVEPRLSDQFACSQHAEAEAPSETKGDHPHATASDKRRTRQCHRKSRKAAPQMR